MKYIVLCSLFLTGCIQLQIPVASTIVNVNVIKSQALTEDSELSGSDIKELMKDLKAKAGNVTPQLTP